MKTLKKAIELIAVVNSNYEHIEQLETLESLYSNLKETEYSKQYPSEYSLTQQQINELHRICNVTRNSHYNKELLTDNAHVDNQLLSFGLKPNRYNVKTRYVD
jgi:hypothetical protein